MHALLLALLVLSVPSRGDQELALDVGEALGTEVYGPALVWIRANRAGEPFDAVRRYRLDDLRAALVAGGADPSVV